MKKKIIATLLTFTALLSAAPVFAYPDCTDENVMALTELGIVSGDEKGNFNPDKNLTRAEFSKMISSTIGDYETILDAIDESKVNRFTDIKGHWASKYITLCQMHNLIDGFEDATFRPDDTLTYAQIIKICLSSTGYGAKIKGNSQPWYQVWADMAFIYGLTESKFIDANRELTRLEAAELIYKTIHMPICKVTGYDNYEPVTEVMDGKDREFESVYTKYFAPKTEEK